MKKIKKNDFYQDFAKIVDKNVMGSSKESHRRDTGRHRSIRFDQWIDDEINGLASERKITFTDMVNHLLEYQLNLLGYSRAKYDAKALNLKPAENLEVAIKTGDVQIENVNGNMCDVSVDTGIHKGKI